MPDPLRRFFIPVLPVLVSIAFAAAGCGRADSGTQAAPPAAAPAAPPTQRVDIPAVAVTATDLESSLQISGSLLPQTRVPVMAKLPGTLARVTVQVGDRVRVGQVVAAMDRREIDAQVDAATAAVNVAQAGLESARANLDNAQLERDRAQTLFDKGALPRQRLDAAETARRATAAQRDLAQANLALSEASLRRAQEVQRDATITSPLDGVVVERQMDPGSLASPNDKPILVVADLRVLKLEAGVSELEAGRLRVGLPVRVTVQARPGETFDGRLSTIAPEVDARNRHFRIEVRLTNPGGSLLAGMYGVATVPLARVSGALAVPREAVADRGGKRVVLRIRAETVTEVPVTEGIVSGGLIQIASGLSAGDVVVADARRDLAAGARVNAVLAN